MTPTLETRLWLAMRPHIEDLLPAMPKAWPGELYRAPSAGIALDPYLRIGRVSVAPVRQMIASGQPHERTGTLIITLVYPMSEKVRMEAYDEIAGQIAEHFTDGTQMSYGGVCVSVSSYPHVQEGYEDGGYWTVPVSVPWRCFA